MKKQKLNKHSKTPKFLRAVFFFFQLYCLFVFRSLHLNGTSHGQNNGEYDPVTWPRLLMASGPPGRPVDLINNICPRSFVFLETEGSEDKSSLID